MRIRYVLVLLPLVLGACVFKPKANPDSASTARGLAVDVAVLDNDTDPRDRELVIVKTTSSARGTATVNPNQTIRYTPNVDAIGDDVFTYQIKNTRGRTSTAEVTVTILDAMPEKYIATPKPATVATPAGGVAVPPAASAAPLPAASAGATLSAMAVSIFTREDDKDAGETVQITLKKGEEVFLQRTLGTADAWPRQTDQTHEIEFSPPVPVAEVSRFTLEVRKVPGLGAGESWIMQLDILGRLSDGRTVSLVPKSLPFRFGGGSSNNRTWTFNAVTPPAR